MLDRYLLRDYMILEPQLAGNATTQFPTFRTNSVTRLQSFGIHGTQRILSNRSLTIGGVRCFYFDLAPLRSLFLRRVAAALAAASLRWRCGCTPSSRHDASERSTL
jgi:hypothetical protein